MLRNLQEKILNNCLEHEKTLKGDSFFFLKSLNNEDNDKPEKLQLKEYKKDEKKKFLEEYEIIDYLDEIVFVIEKKNEL